MRSGPTSNSRRPSQATTATFSAQGRSIKVDTIALDNTDRGPDLLAIARSFYTEAREAAAAAAADIFVIATSLSRDDCWTLL